MTHEMVLACIGCRLKQASGKVHYGLRPRAGQHTAYSPHIVLLHALPDDQPDKPKPSGTDRCDAMKREPEELSHGATPSYESGLVERR